MRVLLDENLDRRLKRYLPPDEFEALTVQERGWGSIENGELLRLAQGKFDIFLTVDRGIPHQQNLSRFDVALALLEARGDKLADLFPLMGAAIEAMRSARAGEVVRVPSDKGSPR